MSGESPQIPVVLKLILAAALVASVVGAVAVVRAVGRARDSSATRLSEAGSTANDVGASRPAGVLAKISGGGVSVERRLPTMAFALQPGESLDARIAPGAFRAEFRVPFYSGVTGQAQLGAEIQGGKIIVQRRGEILLSDYAGERARTAMTTLPVSLARERDEITIIFEGDGRQPCRVRALWQPMDAMLPLPLPCVPSPLLSDDASAGEALVQRFNCVACHASGDAALQATLAANPSPVLGAAGRQLQPAWIRQWLTNPQAVKPGALMPMAPPAAGASHEAIEDLTHFIASMGGSAEPLATEAPNRDLVNTGMAAYHTVGCFACHGALEAIDTLPGGRPASRLRAIRTYEGLGRPSQKTDAKTLAAFLLEPFNHRPSGRMPSLNLSLMEAEAIAAYLIARDQREGSLASEAAFTLGAQRVERGRDRFAAMGCANCHALGPDRPAVAPTMIARPLEALSGAALGQSGCIAEHPDERAPHFAVSPAQRRTIGAFLASLARRKTNAVPLEGLALTMSRLNCASCHVYHGDRGPEAAIGEYFTAIEEADLGDEGRLPPNLSDVGAKLNPQWMQDVLAASGVARPYLGARMPQFGEANVGGLAPHFAAAAGVWSQPEQGPSVPQEYGEIGRELVGAKAMNCIQCHNVAGRPSTGTPGPDLAQMAERLRYNAFSRWIHDPALTRPGTRMPSFFVNGVSGFTNLLGGDADKQVDAMWAYLSLGEFMPLPDGLVDPASLALVVTDEPVIFRSFIKGTGTRAIAVGYPEQIHIAYDATKCRIAAAWEGEFLNAAGAWANRGGMETSPKSVKWTAPSEPLFVSASMAGGADAEINVRFRGYQLDVQRRPVFYYELRAGEIEVLVSEQPVPVRWGTGGRLIDRFTLEGPKGAKIILAPGTRTPRGLTHDGDDKAMSITLDEQGKAAFELEVTW